MQTAMRILLCSLVVALSGPAWSQAQSTSDSASIRQLLDNVDYWKARHREDKVAETWRKILISDPSNVQGLAELAMIEAKAGRKAEAERYLGRLQRINPNHPDIQLIRRYIEVGDRYHTILAEARALVREKRVDEGVAKYREAFGSIPPSGRLGIEFYTTLGGTKGGWQEAKDGLERLAKASPNDASYAMALAKHLTYNEGSRREGIAKLQAMQQRPAAKKEAQAAWKQALLWLQARPDDAPLYATYLSTVGPDDAVKAKMDSLKQQVAVAYVNPGERAFNKGDFEGAERLWREELARNPRSLDAKFGLAQLAMKHGRFKEAVTLLEDIKAQAPGQPNLWRKFLASATFWSRMEKAGKLRDQGKLAEAEALIIQAAKDSPADADSADLMLGGLYQSQGKREQARAKYEAVLRKDPNELGALRALAQLSAEEGNVDEARALNERIVRLEVQQTPDTVVDGVRREAAIEKAAGNVDKARAILEAGLKKSPDHVMLLGDLVNLHLARSDLASARQVVDRMNTVHPNRTETKVALVRVLSEEERFQDAMAVADTVKPGEMTAELNNLRKGARIRILAARQVELARSGQTIEARRTLEQLHEESQNDPTLLGYIALAYSEIGESDKALALIDKAVALRPQQEASFKLMRGAILLRADRLTQLANLLADFGPVKGLSNRERKDLDNLHIALAIRRADKAKESGNIDRSYKILKPLMEKYPEDPRLLSALGRLFMQSDNHQDAYGVFVRLLNIDQNNMEAREGAVVSALALGRSGEAGHLVEDGLELSPMSPQMCLVAARYWSKVGNDKKAAEYLRRARGLTQGDTEVLDDTGQPAPKGIHADTEYNDILRVAFHRFEGVQPPEPEKPAVGLTDQIQAEEYALYGRHSEDLSFAPTFRYRRGVPGLGQLTEITVPVSVSIPTGFVGRLRLTVQPDLMWAGSLDVMAPGEGDRFGRIGAVALAEGNRPIAQTARGASLFLSYDVAGFLAWVGSTPLGFPLETLLGGIAYRNTFGRFGFSIGGARRPVTDSILSAAGAVDPVAGDPWGLVTLNGGRLDLSYNGDPMLLYLYGGFDAVLGHHVASNQKISAGAGLQWKVYQVEQMSVRTGIGFGMMSYRHNLRYFTWGHGGYFSPQMFISSGIPLIAEGRIGRVELNVQGDLGVNWFREDEALYYPTDAALQIARSSTLDGDGWPVQSMYPGQNSLGLAVNLRAQVGYRFTPELIGGLDLAMHYAEDYEEYVAGLFIGWGFRPNGAPHIPVIPPLYY